MPNYGITPEGTVLYSRYVTHGVPTLKAIFPESQELAGKFIKTRKSFKGKIHHHYGCRTRSHLIRRIFSFLLDRIIDKVADGHIFMLPSSTEAHILLESTPDDEVRMMRQRGLFSDYDIVKAGFRIPRFALDFGPYDTSKMKVQIHVPKRYKDRAYKNAQEGKLPYTTLSKRKKIYDSHLE